MCIRDRLWVLSSLLTTRIFETYQYRKPFLVTYLNISSFTFYLIPSLVRSALNLGSSKGSSIVTESTPLLSRYYSNISLQRDIKHKASLQRTLKLSASFCILWFMANFMTNSSLQFTSISSQTILSSTSSFFTLFISALLKIEKINNLKIVGLLLSFFGIIILTKSDNNSPTFAAHTLLDTITGDSLAILGALFYGIYSTLFKISTQKKRSKPLDIQIFFGLVGLITLTCLWPLLVFLHWFQWEQFELPHSNVLISLIVINCSINFISDFCWAKAIMLTSPLTVTMGLSLTIPLAMFVDFVWNHVDLLNATYVIGAMLVMASFLLINRQSEDEEHEDEEEESFTEEKV